MQVERGNLGTIFEGKDVFLTDQEHIGTTAESYSNAGKYEPLEWTLPGRDQIRTNACCGKCYNCWGWKKNKLKIPPESASATAEQQPPTVASTFL